MSCRSDAGNRCVDVLPFGQQLLQQLAALRRQPVESLLSSVLHPPLADQQPLAFQTPEQWIERALVDGGTLLFETLAQRIAVALSAKLCQNRQNQAAAAQRKSNPKPLSLCRRTLCSCRHSQVNHAL